MGNDERGDSKFLEKKAGDAADFENGLCSCCQDCNVLLCSWCCPCVQFGRNCHDLSHDQPESCGWWCFVFVCAFNVPCGVPCLMYNARRRVREEMGLRSRCCCDCCSAIWCQCCMLAQDANEISDFYRSDTDHRTQSKWN